MIKTQFLENETNSRKIYHFPFFNFIFYFYITRRTKLTIVSIEITFQRKFHLLIGVYDILRRFFFRAQDIDFEDCKREKTTTGSYNTISMYQMNWISQLNVFI